LPGISLAELIALPLPDIEDGGGEATDVIQANLAPGGGFCMMIRKK
jgi:hypothetical protein